jgi:taurine dioxygenase
MDVSAPSKLGTRPSGKPVGMEVTGLDLSRPLDAGTFAEVKRAIDGNGVICIRGQSLTPGQLLAFSRPFGNLHRHVRQEYALPGHPEIHLISNVKEGERSVGSAYAGDDWHTDLCFMQHPCHYAILYSMEVPVKDGKVLGDTEFVSTRHAYETLDDGMKAWLAGKRGVFQYHRAQARKQQQRSKDHARPDLTPEQKAATPDVTHNAVITHPVTGAQCLYVNQTYTFGIEGMAEEAAAPVLQRLYAHITRPEFVYRHRWQVGDVIMWDNYQTQHKAIGDYALPQRRLMYRTAIDGTVDV